MNLDWTILYWIQEHLRCGVLDAFMPRVSALGNGGMIWILAGLVLLCIRRYRKGGLTLLLGLFAGSLLVDVWLKPLAARPRPCWLAPDIALLIENPTDYSFPSGHTMAAVVSAVILTGINGWFGLAAVPLAVLIAFSRLYLFVHFPSDVLTSVLLGMGGGFFCLWILKGRVFQRLIGCIDNWTG